MEGFDQPTSVKLSLTVRNVADALDFYHRAFGAEKLYHLDGPNGEISHAEFKIGETEIFISDEFPEWEALAMPEGGRSSCLFCLNIKDCDADTTKAEAAGGEVLSAPQDYFWGMRCSIVLDPFGYRWTLGQVTEELSPEEVARRSKEAYG